MEEGTRLTIEKCTVTAVLAAWYLLMPQTGYANSPDSSVMDHLMSIVSHANVWHLGGNLFVVWLIRRRMYLLPSLVTAFVMSFIPAFGLWPIGLTMGFSGVLFAIAGIKWGIYSRHMDENQNGRVAWVNFLTKVLPLALIGIVIPHINWCIHLYCLMTGFTYGRFNKHI